MQDQSRSQSQKSIKKGLVKVNGKIIYDSANLDNNLPLKKELLNFKRQALHFLLYFIHPSNKR